MSNKLTNIKPREVSGVDKGANRRTFLLIKDEKGGDIGEMTKFDNLEDFYEVGIDALTKAVMDIIDSKSSVTKRESSIDTTMEEFVTYCKAVGVPTFMANLVSRDLNDSLWDATYALSDAIKAKVADKSLSTEDLKDQVQEDLDDFADWVMVLLAAITTVPVEKAGAKISSDRMTRLRSIHQVLGEIIGEAEKPQKGEEDVNKDELTAAIGEAMEPFNKRLEALEKGQEGTEETPPQDTPPTADEFKKMVSDAVTAAMAPLEARLDTVEKAKGIRKSAGNGSGDNSGDEPVKKSIWSGVLD